MCLGGGSDWHHAQGKGTPKILFNPLLTLLNTTITKGKMMFPPKIIRINCANRKIQGEISEIIFIE